jgi:hypothetical protein
MFVTTLLALPLVAGVAKVFAEGPIVFQTSGWYDKISVAQIEPVLTKLGTGMTASFRPLHWMWARQNNRSASFQTLSEAQ